MINHTKSSRRKKLLPQIFKVIFIIALLLGSGDLVYRSGGTKSVYVHIMYIPILLSAYFFHIPGGVIAGLLGGLILGPLIPLDVITGDMQSLDAWIFRMTFFTAIGILSGALIFNAKQQLKKAEWLFYHDEETSLPNRAQLMRYLNTNSLNKNSEYALMVFSLNNHSEITSILDDDEVNELSVQITKRARVLEADVDLFSLVYPYVLVCLKQIKYGREEALKFVSKVHEILQKPFLVNEVPIYTDISVGINIESNHNSDSSRFLRRALLAAQIAKKENAEYWFYKNSVDNSARDSQILLGRVPDALKNLQFDMHYQPIIDAKSQRLVGTEALIRWNSPVKGNISPNQFIPRLEKTSMMTILHAWIMERVIHDLAQWTFFEGDMFINLSARMVDDQKWIDDYQEILLRHNVDPSRIHFEVSESSLLKENLFAAETFKRLNTMGTSLSIDDFGKEYSALNYLIYLPVEYLKIDMSFITDLFLSDKNEKIVRTIIRLANDLGIKSIAEGVERREEYDWLRNEYCDFIQGYYFCKPMCESDFLTWFNQNKTHL